VFETPKARTISLFVTLAVTDVLDIQAGPWRTSGAESTCRERTPRICLTRRGLHKVRRKKVGETRLLAKKGYEKASLGQRVWYTVGGIFRTGDR
jgi:hypothetical protein